MRTAYRPVNASFSLDAHAAAEKQVYPIWFPHGVVFEDTTSTTRDLDYAIDCQLAVNLRPSDSFKAPVHLSVQERWRRPAHHGYHDITVTEWNETSGLPSELHKLAAQLFVYGFYDADRDVVTEAVAVSIPTMIAALAVDRLPWSRNWRRDRAQRFLAFQVDALMRVGAVLYRYPSKAR